MPEPLRILHVWSDPRLLEPTASAVQAGLLKLELHLVREQIAYDDQPACSRDDLVRRLNDFRPHVLHISGHGDADGRVALMDAEEGVASPLSKAVLARMLRGRGLRLLVLDCCHGLIGAEALHDVVGAIIGAKGRVEEPYPIAFSVALYRSIAAGRSLEEAFHDASISVPERDGDGDLGVFDLWTATPSTRDLPLIRQPGGHAGQAPESAERPLGTPPRRSASAARVAIAAVTLALSLGAALSVADVWDWSKLLRTAAPIARQDAQSRDLVALSIADAALEVRARPLVEALRARLNDEGFELEADADDHVVYRLERSEVSGAVATTPSISWRWRRSKGDESLPAASAWASCDEACDVRQAEALTRAAIELYAAAYWIRMSRLRGEAAHVGSGSGSSHRSPPAPDFRLELESTTAGELHRDGPLREGESFRLCVSQSSDGPLRTEPTYLYLLSIGSDGDVSVLYPPPTRWHRDPFVMPDGAALARLDTSPIRVRPPLGRETFVLVTSAEPLPGPEAISGERNGHRFELGTAIASERWVIPSIP